MSTPQPPSNPHAIQIVTRDETWVARNVGHMLDVRTGKFRSMVRAKEAIVYIVATTTIAVMCVFLWRSTDDGISVKDLPMSHIINDEWQASESYALGAVSGFGVGVLGVFAMNQFHPGGPRIVQQQYDIFVKLSRDDNKQVNVEVQTDAPVPLRDIGDTFASVQYNVNVTDFDTNVPVLDATKQTILSVASMLATDGSRASHSFHRLGASRWALLREGDTQRYILTPNDRDVASAVFNVVTKPVFWGSESADALIYDQHQSPVSPQGREILQLLCGRSKPAMPYVRDDWYRLSRGLQRELCQRSTLWAPQSDNDFHLGVRAGSSEAAVTLRYMVNRKPEFYLRHALDRTLMNEEVLYTEIEYQHGRLTSAITAEHGGAFLLLDDDTKQRLQDLWGIGPPKLIEMRGAVLDATRQLARHRIEYMLNHGGILASKVNVQCGAECTNASELVKYVQAERDVTERIAGVLRDTFDIHIAPTVSVTADVERDLSESEINQLRLVLSDNNTVLLDPVVRAAGRLKQKAIRFVPPRSRRLTANQLEHSPEIQKLNRDDGQRIVRVDKTVGSDNAQQMIQVTEPTIVYAVTTADFPDPTNVMPVPLNLISEESRVLGDATMTPYAYFGLEPLDSLWFLDPIDQRKLVDSVAEAFARNRLAPSVTDERRTLSTIPSVLASADTLLRKIYAKLKGDDFDPRSSKLPAAIERLHIWPRKDDFVAKSDVPKRLICIHGVGDPVRACDYVFVHHKCYTKNGGKGYKAYQRCHQSADNEYYVPGGTHPYLGDVTVQHGELKDTQTDTTALYVSDGQNVTPVKFKADEQVSAAYPSDGIAMAMLSAEAVTDANYDFSSFLNWLDKTTEEYSKVDTPEWYKPSFAAAETDQEATGLWKLHDMAIKLFANDTATPTSYGEEQTKKAYQEGKFGFLYGIIPSKVRPATNYITASASALTPATAQPA